jgi:hypothetical protein
MWNEISEAPFVRGFRGEMIRVSAADYGGLATFGLGGELAAAVAMVLAVDEVTYVECCCVI